MFNKRIKDKADLSDEQFFQMMNTDGNFEISPCNSVTDIESRADFTRIELTSEQKIHVGAFLQHIPSVMTANTLAQAYTVKFPLGLPHTLMELNRGGRANSIIGSNGKIIAHASFQPIIAQAAFFTAFTVMSVASGQYFLAQINSELKMMKLNLDKILEFLYGDKKAELMAEVSFVKYAYQNYSSIMSHEHQRIATIVSLQEAKKVAMKDIEFYVSDLDSTVNSSTNDIMSVVNKALQTKESLDLSTQLYVISNLLEVYYVQNQDADYIQYIERDVTSYVDKCERRILSNFSVLSNRVNGFKGKLTAKVDKTSLAKQIDEVVELLKHSEESVTRKTLKSVLYSSTQKSEYHISNNGNVYLKTS